jgi:hypothetical protein
MERPRSLGQPSKQLPSIPETSSREHPQSQPQLSGKWQTTWGPEEDPHPQDSYEIFDASDAARKSQIIETVDSVGSSDIEKEQKDPSKLLVLSLFVSVFLSALDITIITTALPTIAEHMHTNSTGFVWIGSAYLLAGASSEPVWAKISDIFGRKPILMLANATFLAGSVVCALSKSMTTLIAGRVIQGLGSGGLLVLVNILIGDLFSPRYVTSYIHLETFANHESTESAVSTTASWAWYGQLPMPAALSLVAYSQQRWTGDGAFG